MFSCSLELPKLAFEKTVLVVEDNEDVRELMCRIFQRCGFTVLEADNGPHGVEKGSKAARPIDLLICDVILPGMVGTLVASRLLAVWPQMKTVFMSASPDRSVVAEIADTVPFLTKPFLPDAMLELVQTVLQLPGLAARFRAVRQTKRLYSHQSTFRPTL